MLWPAVKNNVDAQTANELRGWAWSENIGWISFNSENEDAGNANNYKVIKNTDGSLSGYAWSEHIGWIKFDPTYGESSIPSICSAGGDCYGAKVVGSDLKGWARACSVFAIGCTGTLRDDSERGGWDGWIRMKNVTLQTSATAGRKDLSGFAWGDLNLGWIKLGLGSSYHVDIPSGGGPTATCVVTPLSGSIGQPFTWEVTAVSGFSQTLPNLTYTWNLLGIIPSPINGSGKFTQTGTYSSVGSYAGNVTISDITGNSFNVACQTEAGSPNIDVGETGELSFVANGDTGGVIWNPFSEISCGASCFEYPVGNLVQIIVGIAPNNWEGCNSGVSLDKKTCSVTIEPGSQTVTAIYGGDDLIITIDDGDSPTMKNRFIVNNPTYPVHSSSVTLTIDPVGYVAGLSVSAPNLSAELNLGGTGVPAPILKCFNYSDGTPISCDDILQKIKLKLYFVQRWPNSNGLSSYNGTWSPITIKVQNSDGSKTGTANASLRYIDPVQQSG